MVGEKASSMSVCARLGGVWFFSIVGVRIFVDDGVCFTVGYVAAYTLSTPSRGVDRLSFSSIFSFESCARACIETSAFPDSGAFPPYLIHCPCRFFGLFGKS